MKKDFLSVTPEIYFARTEKLATETLFKPQNGRTAAGIFKKKSKGIVFCNLKKEPFAYLCANDSINPFFVSCSPEGKRIRYMFGLCDIDKKNLGLSGKSYTEESNIALAIWNLFV